jgi:hypothetical protein
MFLRQSSIVLLGIALLALIGCGSSVQFAGSQPGVKLKNYNNVVAQLINSTGSVSLSTTNWQGLGSAQISRGSDQGVQALESLQFDLMAIGFNFVSSENEADAIIELSIGAIRYDPLAGWIADQATLKFIDMASGRTIAMFRAKGQLITPTVNNLVGNLSGAVRRRY